MNTVPFVFITDDGYAIPTVVAIKSLKENFKKTERLTVIVIYNTLSMTNIDYLLKLADKDTHIELKHYDSGDIARFQNKALYVTPTSLIKFEIANILNEYNMAVYLDGDIVVQRDLSCLTKEDISDQYCLAVQDYEAVKETLAQERLKLDYYFNSGVMVLNLKKIRDEKLSANMMRIKEERKDLFYMDQDVLNIAFRGKIKLLPVSFNYIPASYEPARVRIESFNEFFNTSYLNYDSIKANAHVIHLAGGRKPWKSKTGIFFNEWNGYFNECDLPKIVYKDSLEKKTLSAYLCSFFSKLIKRKISINSEGYFTVNIYVCGIKLVSKIRTNNGIQIKWFNLLTQNYR